MSSSVGDNSLGRGGSDDNDDDDEPDMDGLLAAEDAAEEINEEDAVMNSDDDEDEVILHNDAIAYFDLAPDSLFAIAQHPQRHSLIAVGGSGGRSDDAPGLGWIFDAERRPVLPPSYHARPSSLDSLGTLDGHSDSISALSWTLPHGQVLLSAGLDGRLRAWNTVVAEEGGNTTLSLLAEAREVDEINWLAPCPDSASHPGVMALGASDGSVWVYDVSSEEEPLRILQSYYLHTASCTAGAWSLDGNLLATVSEDGSLCVWDVWHLFADAGLRAEAGGGLAAVSLTTADQRFAVDGGLFSVAMDPGGAFVAVGGAAGAIRIVSLPRLSPGASPSSAGQVLASLCSQSDSIESLATTRTSSTTLLAAGSVDGSIAIFDATRRFSLRRLIHSAHQGLSVVHVDFVPSSSSEWLLDSCGLDGVLRRWDLRSADHHHGPLREWRGHRGGDDGAGGVLGFVRGPGGHPIVTAGDDGLALVFVV
ncbi:hypothetical protein XA68_13590 [Ophiocordyceps unilateralis]|uniref:Uncharacterized protein n=1 Tax=Ophiocordyceps unilateralis TaxID=268505 RepID=A0A2A9PAG2_OPHUN|nr:hypothetical protein XA68_13590 [Ophiocordyceps unilateralis]